MRRFAVLVTLAACNVGPPTPAHEVAVVHAAADAAPFDPWANPKPPPPSPVKPAASDLPYIQLPTAPASAPEPPPPPVTYGPAPRPPAPHAIVAAPSQAMRALAVMPDGSAAVSADVAGSVRLWPTLDGSREPVIVQMRRPVALAVTHVGAPGTNVSGIAIAGIDGAGQLELVITGPLGEPKSRTPIELPRPASAVFATTRGFLVERDDQHLAFVTPAGQLLGDVEPPAGTHIAAIAVHDDAMLALLASGSTVHGTWLSYDGHLHWGADTATLPIAPRTIALAPNHTSIAAIQQTSKSTRLVVIGLERGDQLDVGQDNDFVDPTMEPIGFVDATTVLVRFEGMTELWHTDGGGIAELGEDRRSPITVVAGGKVINGGGADLVIADAAGTVRYLGFRIATMSMFAPGGRALLATNGQRVIRLAADLREHASFELPQPHDSGYSVMTLLDANHVLLESYRAQEYFDVIALDTMEVTPLTGTGRFTAYDPSTRIAAFIGPAKVLFRRFDPKTATFGDAAELEATNVSGVAFIGDHASITTYRDDGAYYAEQTISRIRPEAHTLKLGPTTTHPLVTEGEGSFIPPSTEVFTRTAKSADGMLVATLAAGRMTLRDADGHTRWTVAAPGASDVVWLGSGELLATGAGVARVDLETGAYSDRRCGWQFGLWSDVIDNFASAQMCEAE